MHLLLNRFLRRSWKKRKPCTPRIDSRENPDAEEQFLPPDLSTAAQKNVRLILLAPPPPLLVPPTIFFGEDVANIHNTPPGPVATKI